MPFKPIPLSEEFSALLRKTSESRPKDLILTEVSQKIYEESYEFLLNKYGGAMGRTNLMLNGHLITPDIESAAKAREMIVQAPK